MANQNNNLYYFLPYDQKLELPRGVYKQKTVNDWSLLKKIDY